jgi:polysaccharide export outer membrane protein
MLKKTLFRFGTAVILASAALGYAGEGKPAASAPGTLVASAATDTTNQNTSAPPALQRRNPRYQLCKGDIMDLHFPFSPEYNQSVTVQPDGYITLLDVGDLHVEGQTIPELTATIQSAYTKILHEPEITIQLKDFEKPYFIAGGEVLHPGKYDLRGDTTAAQAVAIAGGFTEASKHSQVYLFRRVSNDWVETQKLDMKRMLASGNLHEDMHLRPGDMLFVPKNVVTKVKRFLPTATLATYFGPIL